MTIRDFHREIHTVASCSEFDSCSLLCCSSAECQNEPQNKLVSETPIIYYFQTGQYPTGWCLWHHIHCACVPGSEAWKKMPASHCWTLSSLVLSCLCLLLCLTFYNSLPLFRIALKSFEYSIEGKSSVPLFVQSHQTHRRSITVAVRYCISIHLPFDFHYLATLQYWFWHILLQLFQYYSTFAHQLWTILVLPHLPTLLW